jgi:uncharacterized protein YlxW (UPF0749 family)
MAMGQTLEVVKQIESRAFRLIQKLNSFEEKLFNLNKERDVLEKEKKQLKQEINRLTSENEHLKSANAILGSKEYKRETKLKINRLIREVDSCIVQLSE